MDLLYSCDQALINPLTWHLAVEHAKHKNLFGGQWNGVLITNPLVATLATSIKTQNVYGESNSLVEAVNHANKFHMPNLQFLEVVPPPKCLTETAPNLCDLRVGTAQSWVRKIEISLGLGWWNSAKKHLSKRKFCTENVKHQIRGQSKATFKWVIFLGGWTSWILVTIWCKNFGRESGMRVHRFV